MSTQVLSPFPLFTSLTGAPLNLGYVYIGVANQDPETHPQQAYWDVGLTTPAAQPLRTNGGYIVNSGDAATVYTSGAFSIRVRSNNGGIPGTQVFYRASVPDADALRNELAASGGSALVGFIQAGGGAVARTAQSKLRETVSVLDFGAVGDGSTDDRSAIRAAIATGKDVYVPFGYVFATSGDPPATTASYTPFVSKQRIYGGATFKKIGATSQPIFMLPDMIEGIWFDGITFDGNKAVYSPSTTNTGVMGYVTQSARFTDCTFTGFRDCGIKLRNGSEVVADGNIFHNIDTNGIEVRIYTNDPRTGSPFPAEPARYSGYRFANNRFSKIDDGLHGAGEGCGISVASAVGTKFVDGLVVADNTFEDVLRSIWTENNIAGGEARNVTIVGNTIVGNLSPGTVETKDGIGLIGVKGATVTANSVLNVGNFAPAGGNCSCVQIAGSDLITITGNSFRDDTGNANRTDYYIYINVGTNVTIAQNLVGGASDGVVGTLGSNTGLTISGTGGAPVSHSWTMPVAYIFERENLAASTTVDMLSTPGTAFQEIPVSCPGAPVALSVLLSTPVAAGSLTLKVIVEGVEHTALRITQADFAGGVKFTKAIAASEAISVPVSSRLVVRCVTDGSFLPTTLDAQATITFDAAVKG